MIVAFGAIILLDVASYSPTGTQTLAPTGTLVGKAIAIYVTRLSGNARNGADKASNDLQTKGYTVTLTGVKSSISTNTQGYNIIVIGGPVYAGAVASSVKGALENLF